MRFFVAISFSKTGFFPLQETGAEPDNRNTIESIRGIQTAAQNVSLF